MWQAGHIYQKRGRASMDFGATESPNIIKIPLLYLQPRISDYIIYTILVRVYCLQRKKNRPAAT